MTGRIVHFEVPYDDGDRARAFYREAFGWNLTEVPGLDYTMATTGPVNEQSVSTEPGFINGGMFRRTDELKQPVLTVDVPDIDAAWKTIESLGGERVGEKLPVGDMGFAAYFKDPEGNILGLWQSA
ncbi:VOC family protein [Kribbella sindirgiensis]|uniref:VOC family protein n=1 Tax=Kribbella sindirgiensis TaxID=1124744 RepID=A0A4R0IIX8_9ACTN|nr:VOC family protein [Kribbella sindirgiensis]TCC31176.1 VOC family protein [Kribbella sindirgiensis]